MANLKVKKTSICVYRAYPAQGSTPHPSLQSRPHWGHGPGPSAGDPSPGPGPDPDPCSGPRLASAHTGDGDDSGPKPTHIRNPDPGHIRGPVPLRRPSNCARMTHAHTRGFHAISPC